MSLRHALAALMVAASCARLLVACGGASGPQAQVAAITAGCKASLDIARKNHDPREGVIADGCKAELDVWAADVPDGGAK